MANLIDINEKRENPKEYPECDIQYKELVRRVCLSARPECKDNNYVTKYEKLQIVLEDAFEEHKEMREFARQLGLEGELK